MAEILNRKAINGTPWYGTRTIGDNFFSNHSLNPYAFTSGSIVSSNESNIHVMALDPFMPPETAAASAGVPSTVQAEVEATSAVVQATPPVVIIAAYSVKTDKMYPLTMACIRRPKPVAQLSFPGNLLYETIYFPSDIV